MSTYHMEECQMLRNCLCLLVLFAVSLVADAGIFRARRSCSKVTTTTTTTVKSCQRCEGVPFVLGDNSRASADALDEVNAVRASRGLRPFAKCEGLTKAAMSAAASRASALVAGHTQNDFAHVPSGYSANAAGCAAWEPRLGWGACCTYENWSEAGAAYVLGSDGRRYMHLFVR